ncbi:Big_5 domain-containing protein [Durusdinium trenchii]|uniref:Big_5 domain-containing protein n=1 Tax=Durusdinium trenchii TaxID=1381693 RepID=A0ABP0LKB2_9DINO
MYPAADVFQPRTFPLVRTRGEQNFRQVTIVGDVSPNYLCLSLGHLDSILGSDMQKCKGKPVDITIAAGVFGRVDTTGGLPVALETQLAGLGAP